MVMWLVFQGYGAYGAQPVTAQNQFSYGAPQAQPQGGYQFQQQYWSSEFQFWHSFIVNLHFESIFVK